MQFDVGDVILFLFFFIFIFFRIHCWRGYAQGAQGYLTFQRSATSVSDSGISVATQLLTYLNTATQPFAGTVFCFCFFSFLF
jgi:hypothetical protein